MKLIMNIYDHCVVMHVKLHWVLSAIEELMPFDYLYFNDFCLDA